MRRYEDALRQFDQALALRPELSMAHMDRGNVLTDLGRLEEALAGYERAVELAPNNGLAHCNRAITLRDLGRHEEALSAFGVGLAFGAPPHVVLANRGAALTELRRFEDALRDFAQAIAQAPEFALAHWNESLCRLVSGDLVAGWRKYEWRWRYAGLGLKEPRHPQPRWWGESDPAGQTVLVTTEQGVGDALQFCRYVPLLAARGARVVLEAPASVKLLLGSLQGAETIISEGEPPPEFDCHTPLLSLPLAFGTTLATIPNQVPYLNADHGCVQHWSTGLGPVSGRKRVGLAWSGSRGHTNDRNRSIPLAALASLLHPRFEWICLQIDVRDCDLDAFARASMRDFRCELHDFSDTAALMMNLDLIITADTAVAHLAGALARSVWILLPHAPDWRWLIDRNDSPWYPTARLFRQPAIGNWDAVVQDVENELRGFG